MGDTTLEFEKKRNRPLKYDRELIGTTIKAMKRISEIKHNREARHIERRLRGKKKERTQEAIKEKRKFGRTHAKPSEGSKVLNEPKQKTKLAVLCFICNFSCFA